MKRGQAAMEFLMTYGWVLIVALIAIGTLSYFGIVNPNKILPEICNLGPGFACVDFQTLSTGHFNLKVTNAIGRDLDFFAVEIIKDIQKPDQLCGGYFGIIVENKTSSNNTGICDETNKCKHFFKDSTSKMLKSVVGGTNSLILEKNIVCFNHDIDEESSCCTYLNQRVNNGTFFENPVNAPSCTPLPDPEYCNDHKKAYGTAAGYRLIQGGKFDVDLKIYYKIEGSNIIHQRKGSIVIMKIE